MLLSKYERYWKIFIIKLIKIFNKNKRFIVFNTTYQKYDSGSKNFD